MAVTITNPSAKVQAITPSANALTYGGVRMATAAIKKDGTAGTVTFTNDIGDSVTESFAENQILPITTTKVTAISAGGANAYFQNN